jgi:Sec-independent protein translocase protein TatA
MITRMGFGFSGEMIFLFVLALIIFGPRRLPEIGRQIGRIMNEFRRASNEFRSQIESEINVLDTKNMPQILPPLKEPLGSLASRILNPPVEREAAKPLPPPENTQAGKDAQEKEKSPTSGSASTPPAASAATSSKVASDV